MRFIKEKKLQVFTYSTMHYEQLRHSFGTRQKIRDSQLYFHYHFSHQQKQVCTFCLNSYYSLITECSFRLQFKMLLLKQKNAKTSVWPVRITDTLVENFAAASEYLSSSTENCIIIKITQFSYIYTRLVIFYLL